MGKLSVIKETRQDFSEAVCDLIMQFVDSEKEDIEEMVLNIHLDHQDVGSSMSIEGVVKRLRELPGWEETGKDYINRMTGIFLREGLDYIMKNGGWVDLFLNMIEVCELVSTKRNDGPSTFDGLHKYVLEQQHPEWAKDLGGFFSLWTGDTSDLQSTTGTGMRQTHSRRSLGPLRRIIRKNCEELQLGWIKFFLEYSKLELIGKDGPQDKRFFSEFQRYVLEKSEYATCIQNAKDRIKDLNKHLKEGKAQIQKSEAALTRIKVEIPKHKDIVNLGILTKNKTETQERLRETIFEYKFDVTGYQTMIDEMNRLVKECEDQKAKPECLF